MLSTPTLLTHATLKGIFQTLERTAKTNSKTEQTTSYLQKPGGKHGHRPSLHAW